MAKYDAKFKYEIVQRCLRDGDSAKAVGKEFKIGHSTVRRWVNMYRHHGLDGLNKKHEHYSADFKLSVLKLMKQDGLSHRETEAMFNLRGIGTVSRWSRLYHDQGLNGLKSKRRGRAEMTKPKHSPKPLKTPVEDGRTRQDLLDEIEYLRAEVDFLKKRRALIQAEKAAALKLRDSCKD